MAAHAVGADRRRLPRPVLAVVGRVTFHAAVPRRRRPVRVVAIDTSHLALLEALALAEVPHLVRRGVVLAILGPDGAEARIERLAGPVRERPAEEPRVTVALGAQVHQPLAAEGTRVQDRAGLV